MRSAPPQGDMKFAGYRMFLIIAAFIAAEHQRAHERDEAYWRAEWVDDDYNPDYRHWWEKQVPPMQRWNGPIWERNDAPD